MKIPQKEEKLRLYDGCYTSPISVIPKNWNTKKAKVSINWLIHYRFYDPKFDKPRAVQIRGMNNWKTLKERQTQTKLLIENEKKLLVEKGLNQITGEFMKQDDYKDFEYIVSPDEPWIKALKAVIHRVTQVKSTKSDLSSVINGISKESDRLRFMDIPIKDIKRRHILKIFDQCRKNNPKFTNTRQNKYRSYLLSLFRELRVCEAIEYNPISDIPILNTIKTEEVRDTLTHSQRVLIDKVLKRDRYEFWRYIQIFFRSGAREIELFNVQKEDVDLENQRYKATILKGGLYARVWKIITDDALPFWKELMKIAKTKDYIFSKGLVPGPVKINAYQVTRRWKRHVKDKMGVTADIYALKHLYSTAVTDAIDQKAAAKMNSHKDERMVDEVYDIKRLERKQRKDDELKSIPINFS